MSKTIEEALRGYGLFYYDPDELGEDAFKPIGDDEVAELLSEIEQIIRECEPKESICWDGTDISHRFMECATCRANQIVDQYTNNLIERIDYGR